MASMTVVLFSLLFSAPALLAKRSFKVEDCGGENAIFKVENSKVHPYPIEIPGKTFVSGKLTLVSDPNPAGYDMEIDIRRKIPLTWLHIPCVAGVGSCTYDLCPNMKKLLKSLGCPKAFADMGLPCECSAGLTAGVYDIKEADFKIPELSGALSFLTAGDYKIDIKLKEKASPHTQVGCFHIEATIENPCEGFLCSVFGG